MANPTGGTGFPLPAAAFVRLGLRDALFRNPDAGAVVGTPVAHQRAALQWLCRAQDVVQGGGVSYGYSLRGGWRPPYIETTGYIVETFFDQAVLRDDPLLRDRALRMCAWLLWVQRPDGSFGNPRFGAEGIVFDTGQDLFGLVRGFEETRDRRYLSAAERAADWLVHVADAKGRWTRNEYKGVPHVYNARTAWALLRLNSLSSHPDRMRVARANLDWAVSQQRGSGLFDHCAFTPGIPPFTHTIAYAVRGLWESGELLNDDGYRIAAIRAAEVMAQLVREDGFLPGQVDEEGNAAAAYVCLTGNCQLAIVLAKMHRVTGEPRFRTAAVAAVRHVMALQDLHTQDLDLRGGIKGSHPVWGRYAPFTYPNWAAKFFVDAVEACAPWM